MKYVIDLPYEYNALEPVLSAENVTYHHDKHHKSYENNLISFHNEKPDISHKGEDLADMIKHYHAMKTASEALQSQEYTIAYNLSAQIYNHNIYFENLRSLEKNSAPLDLSSDLFAKLATSLGETGNFESKEALQNALTATFKRLMAPVMGSFYIWCLYNKKTGQIEFLTSKDAENYLHLSQYETLFNVDGWEHAWYPTHLFAKPAYIEAIVTILDWDKIEERYQKSIQ